jgi:D-alanyl-D-alanine carboxypeptidase/D-alanyl-D-alanine-endopeptidase (penicillin-binding protein 4)
VLAWIAAALGLPPDAYASALGALQARLARDLSAGGGATSAYAVDLKTGAVLLSHDPDVVHPPASVEKLYTTTAVLTRYGVNGRLRTSTFAAPRALSGSILQGNLYLRGGGDPTFGAASFDQANYGTGATVEQLAGDLAALGIKRVSGRVIGDETFLDSRRGEPSSGYGIDPYLIGELSGLAFDRGFSDAAGDLLQANPPLVAANALATTLRRRGVKIGGASAVGRTPASDTSLVYVRSPTMARLVSLMDTPSDNFFAETLIKDLGAQFGTGGTTAAGAAVVRAVAAGYGLHPHIVDGSGLSRSDHTSARMIVSLLTAVIGQPFGATLRAALAVAGRSGTLAARMQGTIADGRCQAKTGTLTGVSALAGYCNAANGHEVVFALLYDNVNVDSAHASQDAVVEDLARAG